MVKENLPLAIALALATSFCGTLGAAAAKFISGDIDPHLMVCTQYLVCLLSLTPWLIKRRLQVFETSRLKLHAFRALVGWAGFYTYYFALGHIPLVDAGLLRNTAPLCVPFIVMIWLRYPVARLSWFCILIGFAGVSIILRPSGEGMSIWHLVGFLSGLSLAFSMVCTKELSSSEPPNQIVFYYFFLSFLFSLPFALINFTPPPLTQIPLLLLVGFSIFITMKLYTKAFSHAPTSVLAPFSYFGVVFAGFLDWLIWNHTPDLTSLAGIALVSFGGITTLLVSQKQQNATSR